MINKEFILHIDSLSLYALYANTCLALQHPGNKGPARKVAINAARQMGAYLVENGIITQAMRSAHEKGLLP